MVSDKLIRELQIIAKEEGNMSLSFKKAKKTGEFIVKYFKLLMEINDKTEIVEKPKKE